MKADDLKNLGRRGVLLSALAIASVANAADDFHLQLSLPSSPLTYSGTPGRFSGGAVTFSVQTNLRRWRLYVVADSATGPDGAIEAGAITLTAAQLAGSSAFSTVNAGAFKLVSQKPLAAGYPIGAMTPVGTVQLGAAIPVLTRPGSVVGGLHFFYQDTYTAGAPILPVADLTYSFAVEPYATVSFGKGGIDFSITGFGDYVANSNLQVIVTTNNPSGATVNAQLAGLSAGVTALPPARACLAIGLKGSPALAGIGSLPLGTGSVSPTSITAPFGSTTYYVAARLLTTFSDKPGMYSGDLLVTTIAN